MKLPQKSNESFLHRQAKKIIIDEGKIDELLKIGNNIYNEDIGSWAILKLIFLNYWADEYVPIIKKRFSSYFYVDLFAGSGISKIENSKYDFIFGSPLLIAMKYKFTKFLFCENNAEGRQYSEALQKRLEKILPSKELFLVYSKNCNYDIDEIVSQIQNGHSLIFIDPYGMEITWNTMEKILQLKADIIINFQTSQVGRGLAQKKIITPASLNFFKNKNDLERVYNATIKKETLGETLLQLYKKDIIDFREKNEPTIVESVRVKKGDERFYYDLIFVVRKTKGGNPWLEPILEAGKEIEKLDAKDVEKIINIIKGRQLTLSALNSYLPKKQN